MVIHKAVAGVFGPFMANRDDPGAAARGFHRPYHADHSATRHLYRVRTFCGSIVQTGCDQLIERVVGLLQQEAKAHHRPVALKPPAQDGQCIELQPLGCRQNPRGSGGTNPVPAVQDTVDGRTAARAR